MSRVETERAALADELEAGTQGDHGREQLAMVCAKEEWATIIAALRAPTGGGSAGAESMRERCARWHDDEARRYSALALNADRSLGAAMYRQAAQEHRGYAAAIRALPIDPLGSQDAGGAEGRR